MNYVCVDVDYPPKSGFIMAVTQWKSTEEQNREKKMYNDNDKSLNKEQRKKKQSIDINPRG